MHERILARGPLALALTLAVVVGVSGQQAGENRSDRAASGRNPGPITLAGCVERGTNPNEYTIDDGSGGRYRVSGSRINRYLGQRVEVVGNIESRRVRVRTGLYPSPNTAGQAGAIDPVKAAIAAQPAGTASGTGSVDLPGLKVKSVKTLNGGCR